MTESLKLNTGDSLPAIGFGTWGLDNDQTVKGVMEALEAGYRLIDTAKLYANERGVGQAIRDSDLPREQIKVTTKLWHSDHGYHSARAAFEKSLARLGLEYIDLYLIHGPRTDQRQNAWRALTELCEEGSAKAVGVSNYEVWHLEELLSHSDVVPAVNQIEFHPFNYQQQKAIVDFCHKHDIVVEAYSPLAQGHTHNPTINEIAKKHKRTNAQVMLRWAIQHGTLPIPKTAHRQRMEENIDVFRFELSDQDMQSLDDIS